MGAAAPILMAVGGTISAAGQQEEANAESSRLRREAAYSRLAAADTQARGGQEAGLIRTAGSRVINDQKLLLGASGVDLSSASALELMASSRAYSELDAKTAMNNAMREAWGLKEQARSYGRAARKVERAGRLGAIGSMLGGMSGASKFYEE